MTGDNWMQQELDALEASGNLRTLKTVEPAGKHLLYQGRKYLNLSSNDYLGLSETSLQADFARDILSSIDWTREYLFSNPASRLMTGNSRHYEELETSLSTLYGGRNALVLGSGFLVNSGLLPALARKGDLILADKLVHASVIEGLRLGEAEWKRYRHNDMDHLETLLRGAKNRTVWVVTESVFSMDGDIAPLRQLADLKNKYGFKLYIDEAHAFGAIGPSGAGLAAELGLLGSCDILVATFGKAVSSAGAFAITDPLTRQYLVNKMRPLIFSTALPPITLMWSKYIVDRLPGLEHLRQHLHTLRAIIERQLGIPAPTHIIPLPAGSNERALSMAEQGRQAGYWLTAIRYPTVPQGTARIRLSLTAALTEQDIRTFCSTCNNIG